MQRQALAWKREGRFIGFVPTMGYLHEGHLQLVQEARRVVGKQGIVVVSIYVNPTQFGPGEDFQRYPRDLARDKRLCRQEGANAVFVPSDPEMYPPDHSAQEGFSTYVVEEVLSQGMEGTLRPSHFRGVTTVVSKLFHIVLPDVAVFGEKDYQQAAVVGRMIRDLDFPVRMVVAPTVREQDGLAMSSRNAYLSPEERRQAVVLNRAILRIRNYVESADRPLPTERLTKLVTGLVKEQPLASLDYVVFFDPRTLAPLKRVQRGDHMALAVRFGKTRLIDNGRL